MSFVVVGVIGRTIVILKAYAAVLKLFRRMFIPLMTHRKLGFFNLLRMPVVESISCLCVLKGLPAASLKHEPGT